MDYHYIAVEGPIGVGKTTLARQLASALSADFLADTEAGNPYLERFYRQPKSFALHTQLHFLVSRLQVLQQQFSGGDHGAPLVADFMLDKDRLFAELTLDDDEWYLYRNVHQPLVSALPQPDLVVYLQAPLERLFERIERRGVLHEQRIDSQYLTRLAHAYERFFHDYDASSLLIVNTAEINLADHPGEVQRLVEEIRGLPGGRHYFNPMTPSR